MSRLKIEYRENRSQLAIRANLLTSQFVKQRNRVVFDDRGRANFRGEAYFKCGVRISSSIHSVESLDKSLASCCQRNICKDKSELCLEYGEITFLIPLSLLPAGESYRLQRDINLAQSGLADDDAEQRRRLAAIRGQDSTSAANSLVQVGIALWVDVNIRHECPSGIYVKDTHEKFENSRVVSGGLPETNRRKF